MASEANKSAIILLGTLKTSEQSNTQALSDFFAERLKKKGASCEIVKLADHNILRGTYSDMGAGDDWPAILEKILASDILIFASPIWWGNHSSEIQRVIERLDELHDEILQGKPSRLDGKAGGVIVTGDSDGAQNIIAAVGNFFNAMGIAFPPFVSLSVLWEGHKKGTIKSRDELFAKYEKEYAKTADKMIDQLLNYKGKEARGSAA